MTYNELVSELWWELRAVALDGRFVTDNNSAERLLMKAFELGYADGEEEGAYKQDKIHQGYK